MNESEPNQGEERPELSAATRYYAYFKYAKNDYSSALISMVDLIDRLPFTTKYSQDDLVAAGVLPTELELAAEPRIAHERLALVPLLYFGPEIEVSDCDLKVVANWYGDVINGISKVTNGDHDESCFVYDQGNSSHRNCEKSQYCPNRIMEYYLSEDVRSVSFKDFEYTVDPTRKHDIALMKLRIGQKFGIFDDRFAEPTMRNYEKKFRKFFADTILNEQSNIGDDPSVTNQEGNND